MKKPNPVGRPPSPPSIVMTIPVDKLSRVEKFLGRELCENQTPIVKVRVALTDVPKIKKLIKD